MRFVALVLLGLCLALPAMAQQSPPGQGSSGHAFGSTTCPQTFPCENEQEPDYVSIANTCVTQQFGFHSETGFFNDVAVLGSNNCLTPIPGVIPKGMGAQLSPQCCITKVTDTTCTFRCILMGN